MYPVHYLNSISPKGTALFTEEYPTELPDILLILCQIVFFMAVVFAFVYEGPVLYLTLGLITSTAMGLLPHYLGVSKSHLMGVLILPAIIIYMQMFV